MYTIKDSNSRVTVSSFADAVHNISEWYQDYAEWATGSATPEEHQKVRDAIDSVDSPEFGGDLQDYANKICEAIAKACGGKDFHGHGNYSVSAADQMGLGLTVELADAEIEGGLYFIQPEGGDWVAIQIIGNEIAGMTCGANLQTHNAADDMWSEIEPSDDDETVDGDEAETIVRKYAVRIGQDIDSACVVVSKPAEDEDNVYEGNGFTLSFTDGTEVIDDYRFDEPAKPADGWIKLECPLGTAVYETFEELCEEHSVCKEARDWYYDEECDDIPILTDGMIRELCIATTRNEAGRHFTEFLTHYEELEEIGLIKINRPVHPGTGMDYDCQYWTLEVTDEGQQVVDANPELHPS